MTFKSVIKIIFGLIAIAGLMIVLLLYVEKQVNEVGAKDAIIIKDTYSVGSDYTSILMNQHVEIGDEVAVGQDMFTLSSSRLKQAINQNEVDVNDLAYPLNENGNVIIKAARQGYVRDVLYREGSFIPANSEIALIEVGGDFNAKATFELSPKQYARINNDTKLGVYLPDGTYKEANISSMSVDSEQGDRMFSITAKMSQENDRLELSSGTPIKAKLVLGENKYYQRAVSYVQGIL